VNIIIYYLVLQRNNIKSCFYFINTLRVSTPLDHHYNNLIIIILQRHTSNNIKKYSVVFSLLANYTDRAIAAGQRS
jgi:hypothetical protein